MIKGISDNIRVPERGEPKMREETKRISVAIPRSLYDSVLHKLGGSQYATISELVRDKLRTWLDEDIVKVKPYA